MEMTFSKTEQSLLTQVMERPRELPGLLDKYLKKGVSRAGFYKALSHLKKDEVVLVKDRVISVNRAWLAKGYQFFEQFMGTTGKPSYFGEQVARLQDDEDLTYTFRSVVELDIFLVNLGYDLLRLGVGSDFLIQERHEFFFALDEPRTNHILKEFERMGGKLYLLSESDSDIDRAVVKLLPTPSHFYITGTLRKETYGRILHAVGDIIIDLRLDKKFAGALEKLYAGAMLGDAFLTKLRELVDTPQRHIIKIYRDPARAHAMQSRFKKYFVM